MINGRDIVGRDMEGREAVGQDMVRRGTAGREGDPKSCVRK